jgi:thiosulfate/3-mercaptopyruvate sulfurtransferase
MALPDMLVDPRWLRAQPSSTRLLLADVRWVPGGHASDSFALGHLPGAVCVDLEADLAAPAFQGPGRHPLPEPAVFAATMSRLGIGDHTSVVAYDDAGGWIAARLWWMLRVLGREVALLDLPSLGAWTAEGGTLETGPPATRSAATFTTTSWPSDRVVAAHEVGRAVRTRSAVLLDARAGERYRGETEPIDPVAGHIPGAVSAEWAGDLGDDGHMLDATALRRRYEALGVGERGTAIASCGSGVTAAFTLFAMERRPRPRPAVRGLVVGLGERSFAPRRHRTRPRRSAVNIAGRVLRP